MMQVYKCMNTAQCPNIAYLLHTAIDKILYPAFTITCFGYNFDRCNTVTCGVTCHSTVKNRMASQHAHLRWLTHLIIDTQKPQAWADTATYLHKHVQHPQTKEKESKEGHYLSLQAYWTISTILRTYTYQFTDKSSTLWRLERDTAGSGAENSRGHYGLESNGAYNCLIDSAKYHFWDCLDQLSYRNRIWGTCVWIATEWVYFGHLN